MITPLSPSAQAVLDASNLHPCGDSGQILAAAVRAAADQVVPSDAMEPRNCIPMAIECQRIRAELLAIADELDAVTTTDIPEDLPEDDDDDDHPSLTPEQRNPSLK
jgi:hypothetical protein